MTAEVRAFQLFYNSATRAALDPDLEPLDNTLSERPDWFEYWPIRKVLRSASLEEGTLYGFFSPKFYRKTGVDGRRLREYAARCGDADVVTFSPYPCHAACFYNVFEHGENHHPGLAAIATSFLREIQPAFRQEQIVNDSRNTVYCNFLVARPVFWREWLSLFERLFERAENRASPLHAALNESQKYVTMEGESKPAQMKIFIAERLASLLLTGGGFRVRNYPPFEMPLTPPFAGRMKEVMALDALKIAYVETGESRYLREYIEQRDKLAAVAWFGGKA